MALPLRWGALDGASNRDLADINTIALQPLREQTDELCLRRKVSVKSAQDQMSVDSNRLRFLENC